MKDINKYRLTGIGGMARRRLATVLRETKGYITPKTVADCLQIPSTKARQLLCYWTRNGWLKRIHHGIYLPIDIAADTRDQVLLDPWKISAERFAPCYIGGWSAAQHWDLTDQIFETTVVLTTKYLDKKLWSFSNIRLIVAKISAEKMFGLKAIWRDGVKVHISDLHKTIIDMLDQPTLGGGILSVTDFFLRYLSLEECNLNTLIDYAQKMDNKAIFKRLGFLLEIFKPTASEVISKCLSHISKGNSQLDPNLKGHRLVKKWHLWIPENLEDTLKKEIL